ncbi:hypothetical protein E4T56_gene17407, partial [Termitomyces sp. T112]
EPFQPVGIGNQLFIQARDSPLHQHAANIEHHHMGLAVTHHDAHHFLRFAPPIRIGPAGTMGRPDAASPPLPKGNGGLANVPVAGRNPRPAVYQSALTSLETLLGLVEDMAT